MSSDNPWTKLTHLGIVVNDLEVSIGQFRALGMGPFKRFSLPGDEFIKIKWRHHFGKPTDGFRYEIAYGAMASGLGIEIFQCISGDSIPKRFLDSKGEGVWHYGYDVENMDKTIQWMEARGHKVVGASESDEGTRMCYFDMANGGGVYFQAHEIAPGSKEDQLMSDRR